MTEILWRPWGEDAFADAQSQNKPILLSITAVWCGFCRAMDEQTYSNEAIAQYVNEHFVPVRADSDKRPDVNARYTMGGWPTTAVLTPEGDVIWGQTFVPPDVMAQALPQILNAFQNDRANLDQHMAQQREQIRQQATAPPLDARLPVTPDITRNAVLGIKMNFDFAHGGFGREQKFPHPEAIELCLEQYAQSVARGAPDTDLRIVLDKTLAGMAEGGLHDADAGGFFRYTQHPDWSEPHHEKLLEDNALLARAHIRAYQILGDERWKTVAEDTLGYLDAVLYDPERGVWGGSQQADEEYYAQPPAERAEWNPPGVDPTILCGPNAQAVRAHVAWWQATGDADALAKARRGLDFLLAHLRRPDNAFDHFVGEDAEQTSGGLLGDCADVTAASLDLYEAGQGVSYLSAAEQTAHWVKENLEDPVGGAFLDSVTNPDATGNMKFPTRDLADNMQMADALIRLYLAVVEEDWLRLAQRTLQAFLPASQQLGFLAAGFALAAERALLPPVFVHILGPLADARTGALLAAAHRPYRFERLVQPLDPADPEDAEHIENLEYPVPTAPVAYVRVGIAPPEPTGDPATLTERVRTA